VEQNIGSDNSKEEISRVILGDVTPMRLDCGFELKNFGVAYKTYGKLNKEKTNAILVCHALSGDQFVSGINPFSGRPGWWNLVIGPNKLIDTERFFVICPNIIGGCMGTIGPKEINCDTGQPWGLDFPVITISDMVRAQALLLDYLGVDKLFCAIGGSMGGMQVLEWAVAYPDRVFAAIPIATASHHSAQNIAFHEVGRQAIMADKDWCGGNYFNHDCYPKRGLG